MVPDPCAVPLHLCPLHSTARRQLSFKKSHLQCSRPFKMTQGYLQVTAGMQQPRVTLSPSS